MRIVILILCILISKQAISATETFICNYKKLSTDEGFKKVGKKGFKLTFIRDLKSGKSYVVGNQGSEEVMEIPNRNPGSITFIEITGTGNVMTTTISAEQKVLRSVHSRHTIINILIPSQYYGTCDQS